MRTKRYFRRVIIHSVIYFLVYATGMYFVDYSDPDFRWSSHIITCAVSSILFSFLFTATFYSSRSLKCSAEEQEGFLFSTLASLGYVRGSNTEGMMIFRAKIKWHRIFKDNRVFVSRVEGGGALMVEGPDYIIKKLAREFENSEQQ